MDTTAWIVTVGGALLIVGVCVYFLAPRRPANERPGKVAGGRSE
jgi:hypothetical protein